MSNEVSANNDIPEGVILALAEVRESGALNMFDRGGVILMVEDINDEAGMWLRQNKARYMDALNAMGAHITRK